MRPPNQHQARQQMTIFLNARMTGRSGKHKNQVIKQSAHIAEILWRRWQVGVHGMQLKHCQWLLEVHLRASHPGTRYRYWLRLRDIMRALGKYEHWEPRLRGSWRNPNGSPFITPSPRGRPPKYCPEAAYMRKVG